MSAAAILIWGLSVIQGFIQNAAYAELATTFPKASGLPGFAQHVFRTENYKGKYDKGKLIGGFTAWSYWFAWNPVLAIFAILVGGYLHGLFPVLAETFTEYQLALISGLVIFTGLFIVNWFGLKDGAILGYILAAVSLIPLVILTVAPFATGHVELANITGNWWPADWAWDMHHILILFGIFAIAQWSACGWETAAIYAPEYKNPSKDVPKALLSCGIICFLSYVLVQAAVIGVLGVDGVTGGACLAPDSGGPGRLWPGRFSHHHHHADRGHDPDHPNGLPGFVPRHALHDHRRQPSQGLRQNEPPRNSFCCLAGHRSVQHGPDFHGSPSAIVAAAAIGYTCANGISLFAYVGAKKHPAFANLERPFEAPKGWKNVALIFGLFNLPLCLIGVVYLNSRKSAGPRRGSASSCCRSTSPFGSIPSANRDAGATKQPLFARWKTSQRTMPKIWKRSQPPGDVIGVIVAWVD